MPHAQPLHVLVVDDEPDIVWSTVALLSLNGFRATGASGGAEAVALASAEPPDVALVDLGMPEVDGFEVARRLRKLARPPLLIAVTGRPMNWDREQAARAGFSVYLEKPVGPGELLSLLGHCQTARAGRA
jgi:CheY-like chemotaxis protein